MKYVSNNISSNNNINDNNKDCTNIDESTCNLHDDCSSDVQIDLINDT